MAQTMSPAGQALTLQVGAAPSPESDEERKKRLLALQASQRSINQNLGGAGALSPAGVALLSTGGM